MFTSRQSFQATRAYPGLLDARYPAIPAMWPNRATRRAVKQGRESRLSGEWRQVLAQHPQRVALRLAIKAL